MSIGCNDQTKSNEILEILKSMHNFLELITLWVYLCTLVLTKGFINFHNPHSSIQLSSSNRIVCWCDVHREYQLLHDTMSNFNNCLTLTGYGELIFVLITTVWIIDMLRYIGKFLKWLLEPLSNAATSPLYTIQNDAPDARSVKTSKDK